jgi:hypothetical protein
MKQLLYTLTGISILALPVPLPAEGPEGIVAHTIGTHTTDVACARTGCAGDLVACPVGHALVTAKITYLFMEEVCDDLGPTRCNGRLRGLLENCLDPKWGLNVRGSMLSFTMKGKFRFCFDESGESDCTGTPPSALVVGEGFNRMQGRALLGTGTPIQASDELIMTDAPPFTIDGRETQIRSTLTIYDAALQPDFLTNGCGKKGCGFAGTAVMGK